MNNENDREHKLKFADLLLRNPDDVGKAARLLFPFNQQKAMLAIDWQQDPIVLEEKEALLAQYGEKHFLPTKEQFSRTIYSEAEKIKDPELKHKFYRLYADTQGFIEKPGTQVNVQTNLSVNKVMRIPVFNNQDSWEARVVTQQKELLESSK